MSDSKEDKKNKPKDSSDLTSLFELSDFDHQYDPEAEAYFGQDDVDETQEDTAKNTAENEELPPDNLFSEESFPNLEDISSSEVITGQDFIEEDLTEEDLEDEGEELKIREDQDFEDQDFNEPIYEELPSSKNQPLEDDFFSHDLEEEQSEKKELSVDKPHLSEESPRETLAEVASFINHNQWGKVSPTGNPPFSLIVENIRYEDDAREIKSLLEQYGFINDENKKVLERGLERGSIIISRVSEYAAIFLYQKIHHFDLTLKIGPSELLFPVADTVTKIAPTSHQHVWQNRHETQNKHERKKSSILLSSTPEIPGYYIQEFLGHCLVSTELQAFPLPGEDEIDLKKLKERNIFQKTQEELIQKLKEKLLEQKANAGVSFKISILSLDSDNKMRKPQFIFQVIAECNGAWISKSSS